MFRDLVEHRDTKMSSCHTTKPWIFLLVSFVEFAAELFLAFIGGLFVIFYIYKCLTKYDYPVIRGVFGFVNYFLQADLILQTVIAVELVLCWGNRLPVIQAFLSLWLINRYRLRPAGNIGLFDPVDFYQDRVKWQYLVEIVLLFYVHASLYADTKQQFYGLSEKYVAMQDNCRRASAWHY